MLPDSPAMMIPLEAFDERLGDGPTHDKFVRVTESSSTASPPSAQSLIRANPSRRLPGHGQDVRQTAWKAGAMEKDRVIAFSDGVIAVIITIMVLEMKAPHATDLSALKETIPVFLSYVLSFVYVAIYWSNHHHFFHLVHRVNGGVLWANLHLLFWLSLVPFTTSWMGENFAAAIPTAVYGVSLLMAALGWYVMQTVIVRTQGRDSALASALGADLKGKISPLLYIAGILSAFFHTLIADAIYVLVALMWLVPDKRIERMLQQRP